MMRLSKDEWNQLDQLLGKHGFGGYYDLVDCLKMVVAKVGKDKLKHDWGSEVRDLPAVVNLLLAVTKEEKLYIYI